MGLKSLFIAIKLGSAILAWYEQASSDGQISADEIGTMIHTITVALGDELDLDFNVAPLGENDET